MFETLAQLQLTILCRMSGVLLVEFPIAVFSKLCIAGERLSTTTAPELTASPFRGVLRINVPEFTLCHELTLSRLRVSLTYRYIQCFNQ